jgi:hypothetical protein
MNYDASKINTNTYNNDNDFYSKNIQKTETNLHTRTKETLRKSDENISKYYKPKYYNPLLDNRILKLFLKFRCYLTQIQDHLQV